MDLKIIANNIYTSSRHYETEITIYDVDNIDDIARQIAIEVDDVGAFITQDNINDILDAIGVDKVKEYFDLAERAG